MIVAASNEMGVLVDGLLESARMGTCAPVFGRVALTELARSVVLELRPDSAGRSPAVAVDERLRLVPVVMLTSSRQERDVMSSYGLGANAYVIKPVDFHDFVEAVKTLGCFWALVNHPPRGE